METFLLLFQKIDWPAARQIGAGRKILFRYGFPGNAYGAVRCPIRRNELDSSAVSLLFAFVKSSAVFRLLRMSDQWERLAGNLVVSIDRLQAAGYVPVVSS
jgi:hypothetical protein